MHYGPYGFNKDSTKPTIIAPAGKKIGQRVSLSDVSIKNVVFEKGMVFQRSFNSDWCARNQQALRLYRFPLMEYNWGWYEDCTNQ